MEMPPGFVPASVPKPAESPPPVVETPKALEVPPPPPKKDRRTKEKVVELKSKTLRVYYVGGAVIGYLEQWFGDDGTPALYLSMMEIGLPCKTLEEADRYVVEKLRGKPIEVPFQTTERIQGYRITFELSPTSLAIDPLTFATPPCLRLVTCSRCGHQNLANIVFCGKCNQPTDGAPVPAPPAATPTPAQPALASPPPPAEGEELF